MPISGYRGQLRGSGHELLRYTGGFLLIDMLNLKLRSLQMFSEWLRGARYSSLARFLYSDLNRLLIMAEFLPLFRLLAVRTEKAFSAYPRLTLGSTFLYGLNIMWKGQLRD